MELWLGWGEGSGWGEGVEGAGGGGVVSWRGGGEPVGEITQLRQTGLERRKRLC